MSKRPRALAVAFNQDMSCFVAAFDNRFTIYSVDPFAEVFHTNFSEGKVAFVEMLYRSNILAIALRPTAEGQNRLLIWDDNKHVCLKEYNFKTPLLGVRLSKEHILVAIEGTTFVCDLRSFAVTESLETSENKYGLLAMASAPARPAFACLGAIPGQVRVMVATGSAGASVASPNPRRLATTLIQAHSTALVAMALNPEATLLATSSIKGTLVRVYNTETSQLLHELRRGAETCLIYSIAFRADSAYVACTSDKFNAHVFSLKDAQPAEAEPQDTKMPLQSMAAASISGLTSMVTGVSNVLPSFMTAQRSFAQFRVTDCTSRHIIGFCNDNASVAIVCDNGRFFRASYGGGGECAVLQSKVFDDSA
jgi:hypothetical protein